MNRPHWYPTGTLTKQEGDIPFLPEVVQDVNIAFPASVGWLLPPVEDIPDEFGRQEGKWSDFFSDLFYAGISHLELYPEMTGTVDPEVAWRHLSCILRSFEPKHEYKEAAFGFLCSLWFSDVKYTKGKK